MKAAGVPSFPCWPIGIYLNPEKPRQGRFCDGFSGAPGAGYASGCIVGKLASRRLYGAVVAV